MDKVATQIVVEEMDEDPTTWEENLAIYSPQFFMAILQSLDPLAPNYWQQIYEAVEGDVLKVSSTAKDIPYPVELASEKREKDLQVTAALASFVLIGGGLLLAPVTGGASLLMTAAGGLGIHKLNKIKPFPPSNDGPLDM